MRRIGNGSSQRRARSEGAEPRSAEDSMYAFTLEDCSEAGFEISTGGSNPCPTPWGSACGDWGYQCESPTQQAMIMDAPWNVCVQPEFEFEQEGEAVYPNNPNELTILHGLLIVHEHPFALCLCCGSEEYSQDYTTCTHSNRDAPSTEEAGSYLTAVRKAKEEPCEAGGTIPIIQQNPTCEVDSGQTYADNLDPNDTLSFPSLIAASMMAKNGRRKGKMGARRLAVEM